MPHEEIYQELAECQASGELVAYHIWGDEPGSFLVGVVEELSPTKVIFRDVDISGKYEGLAHGVPLRRIHTIDRRTHYLWRLTTLRDLGAADPIDERIVTKPTEVLAVLEEASRNGFIVRIWTAARESKDYFVISASKRTVALESVTDGDQRDGRSVIRLDRIVRVRVGPFELDNTRVHRHWQEAGFPLSRSREEPGL